MRTLNAKQKKLIKKTLEQDSTGSIMYYDNLPRDVKTQLDEINCHECLESNADRFIGDWRAERIGRNR